jgi:hypothetical protein
MKNPKLLLIFLLLFIFSGCSNNIQDENKNESVKNIIYPFQKKDNKIYYKDTEIADAESESFEVYEKIKCHDEELGTSNCFAHDANSVFYLSTKIDDAEPDGFVFLEDGYKKDTDSVFYIMDNNRDWYIEEADADSFYVLGHSKYYFKSKNCHSDQDYCVSESNYSYAKDNRNAYYDGEIIPKADGSSFVLIIGSEKYDAMDKNYKYKNGIAIE